MVYYLVYLALVVTMMHHLTLGKNEYLGQTLTELLKTKQKAEHFHRLALIGAKHGCIVWNMEN